MINCEGQATLWYVILKGLLDYAIKIAAIWVACKKLHARIARPFTLRIYHRAIFKTSVSVIVFQLMIVYLKSNPAYPIIFTKAACIIFFSFPNEDILNSSYFCENNLNIYIQWRNTHTIIDLFYSTTILKPSL